MSKFKDVTDNQGLGIARMARAKRVPRQLWADAEEDGTFSRVLDAIRDGEPITIGMSLIPPLGARLHILQVSKLSLDKPWLLAARLGDEKKTLWHGWDIHNVGHLYQPTGVGEVGEEHVLLNWPSGRGSFDEAVAWAREFGLVPNDPRRVFGMAEQYPDFHHSLGMSSASVVAPIACEYQGNQQACFAHWIRSGGCVAVLGTKDSCGGSHEWFSFRR